MPTVLTIAGFDPSSGAGITADLLTFAAHSLFGASCITALTVQSTLGVQAVYPIDPSVISSTLRAIFDDLQPAGIKIGMLGSAQIVQAVCEFLMAIPTDGRGNRPITVLDPVLRSSSGRYLLEPRGADILREQLLRLVDWVTPNTQELACLSGASVVNQADILEASRSLQHRVSRFQQTSSLGIVATGGHLDPPDDLLIAPSGEHLWLPGQRVLTESTHGTGCAFSSAFLSRLMWGDSPIQAALAAKTFVTGALKTAPKIGHGVGPMNLLWPLSAAESCGPGGKRDSSSS